VTASHDHPPGAVRQRPRWRGVLHQYAFFASILPIVLLVKAAPTDRAAFAATIYGVSLAALLGVSALYHRITWSPRARLWMGRLDLAMIYLLIAGSYTPIALLVLEPPHSTLALSLVWGGAAFGIVIKLFWTHAPKWVRSSLYVAIGSIGAWFAPEIGRAVGAPAMTLLAVGGFIYIAGAVIYAVQRPDPLPNVFGYHEIFHALVVVAATVHFIAFAAYVVPGSA
jgi:hemolysin III